MKRLIPLALLAFGACSTMTITESERRWKALEGDEVWVATDYQTTVHGVKDCPKLAASKGEVKACKVKGGRVVDGQGLFVSGPNHTPDLCPSCVK